MTAYTAVVPEKLNQKREDRKRSCGLISQISQFSEEDGYSKEIPLGIGAEKRLEERKAIWTN